MAATLRLSVQRSTIAVPRRTPGDRGQCGIPPDRIRMAVRCVAFPCLGGHPGVSTVPGCDAASMLADEARRIVDDYLRVADRLLPGRIEGFYIVGSTALRAYRPGRSDIDFVAVVDGQLSGPELRRLRLVHLSAGARSGIRAISRRRLAFPGTCNGVFVDARDLNRPVTEIHPLASHTGIGFAIGMAST